MKQEYQFKLEFEVRDYECDLQGIVNNAVYQHYLEHARHQFLKSRGIDFAEFSKAGIRLVVARAEIDYKRSLTSQDKFFVGINVERVSPLRVAFMQHIHRLPDNELIIKARIIATGVNQESKPIMPKEVAKLVTE